MVFLRAKIINMTTCEFLAFIKREIQIPMGSNVRTIFSYLDISKLRTKDE